MNQAHPSYLNSVSVLLELLQFRFLMKKRPTKENGFLVLISTPFHVSSPGGQSTSAFPDKISISFHGKIYCGCLSRS